MYRRGLEVNKTLKALAINEYGDSGRIIKRFYKKMDCMEAYRAYFCWINFLRCDINRDLTLPTCRSACVNFFKSCGYARDLWRCGKSKYFNGYDPESPSSVDANGNPQYLRDYFPGQPFRENKFNLEDNPIPICTPSIKGSAPSIKLNRSLFITLMIIIFFAVLVIV